jgi:methylglutaconyl-CoA hydratase
MTAAPDAPALRIETRGRVRWLVLDRPAVHNAFDDALIAALTMALHDAAADDAVRAVVLTGAGTTFSAGADLGWMRAMAAASEADNRADAGRLAALMHALCFLPKPTIARVNGAAYGGGVGLVACCDVAIGVEGAKFSLSEVKLGLVPAAISPYVVAAIGGRQARRLFTSGEVFEAARAAEIGLLHACVPHAELDAEVDRVLHWLGKGGPVAQAEAKALALRMAGLEPGAQRAVDAENAALIARLRVSPEGQEGLGAFLAKRPPAWVVPD